VFNASAIDYQDFELPLSDEPSLIAKICQYVGIEIREAEVLQFGQGEEALDTQETS
jgi:phosphoribosylpyrophosphate synthetase